MAKNPYPILGVISLLLYCVLGFLQQAIEKYLITTLFLSAVSFLHDDFRLNIEPYMTILLVVACVCFAISLLIAIVNIRKIKS